MRLIDADAVIKAIDNHTNSNLQLDEDITCILEEVPTIEERKAGRWIPFSEQSLLASCSLCGEWVDREWNYCPHCGAKMEETT